MNYDKLIELEKNGKALIGVDRVMARQFYIHVPIDKIEKETGEAPYIEKIIVFSAFVLGPLSLLSSIVLGFWIFNWWGIISLIVFPIIYFWYFSTSVRGGAKMIWVSAELIVLACIYFFKIVDAHQVTGLLTAFVLSLWFVRLLYCSSTIFLRGFVIRNERAYQYLSSYLEIKSIE